jgi:type I restriction enzyme S subunit
VNQNEINCLPSGWALTTLGEVSNLPVSQNGPDGDFIYVDISSIDNQTKHIVEPKRLALTEAPSRARQRLQPNDVLISMTRPNLNAVAMLPEQWGGAIGSTGFHVLRTSCVEPCLLWYLVQSSVFVKAMSDLVLGVLYPAVRPKDIAAFAFASPRRSEQSRIVAEIEKQFSRLDAAIAALKRLQANLKRYRSAVLRAACEGHLVPTEAELARQEGRDYEPADVLLKRILTERRARWEAEQLAKLEAQGRLPLNDTWKAKYQEPAAPEIWKLPGLPEGWTTASIGQVTDCLDSMRVPINKEERAKRQGTFPYFGANGQVGWIDDYIFDEPLVLVVKDETFTGRQKPFSYKIKGRTWVNNHAHVLRPTAAVHIDYLNH